MFNNFVTNLVIQNIKNKIKKYLADLPANPPINGRA
jgi:hypothetical protein